MRLTVIACEILFREISWCVSQSKNIVDVRFLRKGLHDVGEKEMSSALQKEIDSAEEGRTEAILLGYALCNNGIRGLRANKVPIVVPRAHDCITLLLGSKERYKEYFNANLGTYFKSTGWIERDVSSERKGIHTQLGLGKTPEELKKQYGEDNAAYIMEIMGSWERNYNRIAYLDMGIPGLPDYEESSKKEALKKGWQFEKVKGDIGLIQRMIDGKWSSNEFLVVNPGEKIIATYDEGIINKA
jgi:hypothetical protein